jgi:glycosyltransferase involved in cell wall biosynthesis
MRFLFVDASHHAWGMERHFVSLATGLCDAGHAVRAIVQRGSRAHELLQPTAVRLMPTRVRGGGDPRLIAAMIRAVAEFGPDWIIANQSKLYWPLLLFGRMTETRVALFRHLRSIKRWSTRTILPRLVDRFFVASDFAREDLIQQGAPDKHVLRLYNPVDGERFKPDREERQRMRSLLGVSSEEVLAGFVGRMSLPKGIGVLRSALSVTMDQVPRLKVLWVGEGEEFVATVLWANARRYGDRSIFLGWRPNIESCYAAMDFLVAPSIEAETFGRMAVEAQCSGIPVIASSVGGLPEALLDGKTGILVPPDDIAALSTAICRLAQDAPLRARLGETGRRFVLENFSSPKICREFVDRLGPSDHAAGVESFQRAERKEDVPRELSVDEGHTHQSGTT